MNPINQQRWKRFSKNKMAMISLKVFTLLTLISLCSELFFNDKALVVYYKGEFHFPFIQNAIPAKTFGLETQSEANYLDLQKQFRQTPEEGNWLMMPFIPYHYRSVSKVDSTPIDLELKNKEDFYNTQIEQLQQNLEANKHQIYELKLTRNHALGKIDSQKYHPLPPTLATKHFLGTDSTGRDILAQLSYGYRIAITFALILLLINYFIGIAIGCAMGYLGSWYDLLMQRIIEVLSNIPFLYIIIIIASILRSNGFTMGFWALVGIYVSLGWMGMTWYMRTATLKEKAREYVLAARAAGASNTRIVFTHILPNVVSLLVTFAPFSISGAIVGLTSLDFLGYGLPKDYPSWGSLIKLGTDNIQSPWIITSIVFAMVLILFLINAVGEGIRQAFDPKKISHFE
ncbi:ABC transporter permease subunit [Lentisphaera profundi]|uniref:ABC transporter permease subunit n=1 Tax=Lentisphaera profundi TaxID=1658616 RepID=A0ABY7VR46_9BACT|nr:ABC transporter permease subunit [Lentisphaera profundi]WDE95693.1 ABC transporter permease subunit [Lentisphaera profundi]